MFPRGHLVRLPPNRVWRTYPGGRTLDELEGRPQPRDSAWAEDWIGSVTETAIPGRTGRGEGLARARIGDRELLLRDALATDPAYFLGAPHLAAHGPDPLLLVKFLDPALRLHFQAHPSREFARARLGARSGKTEAYHVLGVRPEEPAPCVWLGFQRPPPRAELRRMILEQDIAALEACFDPVPLQPGDTILVPGGTPHALGGGLFLVEIQEPSDLVVRFEFSRGGVELPEGARFLGRDVDFALDLMRLDPLPRGEIESRLHCPPRPLLALGPAGTREELIGPDRTPCFRVQRLRLTASTTLLDAEFTLGIVTAGACTVETAGGTVRLGRCDRFLRPAGLGAVHYRPEPTVEILECLPPL